MKKKPIVTVVGSYIVGLTMRADRFPTPGETLTGHSFTQFYGGKGSNQAVGCARLGAEVNFIACIGKDASGDEALKLYRKENVNTELIKYSGQLSTGVGFIIVDQAGSNMILIDIGANNELNPEYIAQMSDVISKSDALLMQMEIPADTVVKTARIAKSLGVNVILNPAPYQSLPDTVWPDITILTPNEKEAKLITGRSPDADVSVETLGADILKLGVKNVIITLGERGAYIAAGDFSGTVPSKKVDVVDTTGAGDSFSAALGVAVAEGKPLPEAVEFAVCASALAVTEYGVIESLPYRKQVEDFMNVKL